MTAAFTFPGQGSQAVGMRKALAEAFPAARAVFDEVDSALSEKQPAPGAGRAGRWRRSGGGRVLGRVFINSPDLRGTIFFGPASETLHKSRRSRWQMQKA
jgi:hypothetical protein